MPDGRILIVEDEPAQRELLTAFLRGKGHAVEAAPDVTTGRAALSAHASSENAFDVVLTDFQMPDGTGLDVLKAALAADPEVGVIVITAYGTVQMAVQAMREGASDVLLKPVDPDVLLGVIGRCLQRRCLVAENTRLRDRLAERVRYGNVVGSSGAMQKVLAMVQRVAPTRATVLVTGESGTGKELIANLLHEHGPNPQGPFVAVNCGALPETLLESELFGHAQGAFTGAAGERRGRFEEASGGTIFLDEVGEISPAVQLRLLRVLQEREIVRVGENVTRPVDVRVVAATNRDLETELRAGRFREDLYYRINVVRLKLPPLRDRPEDVPALVEHFGRQLAERHGLPRPTFTRPALDVLAAYPFPGNVRELQNVVEQALLLGPSGEVRAEDLPQAILAPDERLPVTAPPPRGLDEATAALERRLIRAALARAAGVQTRAAAELGVDERVLRYKMKKHGIRRDGGRDGGADST